MRRWGGLLDRLRTNSRQESRSLFTSVVSWKCRPDALLRACCTCKNMHLDPATAGVMLRISPRSLRHLRMEVVRTYPGMAASAAATFSCLLGGRHMRWAFVSRSHPMTVSWADHFQSPCPRFFREMESFRLMSKSSLGHKTRSIWWKR